MRKTYCRRLCPPICASAFALALAALLLPAVSLAGDAGRVRRVSSVVPFPRGLVLKDDGLYALARGRVRDSGGVNVGLDDRAGSLWKLDATVASPLDQLGGAATNGEVFAEPTSPPFKLLDRSLPRALDDRATDRPYCGLRWHEASKSFYLCAFSGIDIGASDPAAAEAGSFRKNYTDAVLRYDTRTKQWSEVARHDAADATDYDGQPKGPDNLLVVGDALIVCAKDNSKLLAYDLTPYVADPHAAPPVGREILGEHVTVDGVDRNVLGESGLAYRDGWLYVSFRTTSEVIRLPVTDDAPASFAVDKDRAQYLAQFDPFVRESKKPSANLTDIDVGPDGDVYVISAHPARVYRFTPRDGKTFDFQTDGGEKPWCDLAAITGNPSMKSENLIVADDGRVFVTSGDAYGHDAGLGGAVYVIQP